MGAIATLTTPSPPVAARRWSRSSALAGLILVAAIVATPGCVWDREEGNYIAIHPASSEEPAEKAFTGWYWNLHYTMDTHCSCSSDEVDGRLIGLEPRDRLRLRVEEGERWNCFCTPAINDMTIEDVPNGEAMERQWTWAVE